MTPWKQCYACGKIVKLNKPIFGSMHLCLTDGEQAARARPMPPQVTTGGLVRAINGARLPVKKGYKK